MIRINQLKIKIDVHRKTVDLKPVIAQKLHIRENRISEYTILRRSVDARKKPDLYYVYTVSVSLDGIEEAAVVARLRDSAVTLADEPEYRFPYRVSLEESRSINRPIIVGTGPAGLFCGYVLAMNGFRPILLERGEPVEDRIRTVEHYWNTGELNTESNIQFGEGGAGTFSDGKLNTLVKDKDGKNRAVLQIFVENGAEDTILYDYKAHLGTDCLVDVIRTMREKMKQHGADFSFGTKLTDLDVENGRLSGIHCLRTDADAASPTPVHMECQQLVIAIGHSARDTFPMLLSHGMDMEAKDFAVGVRIMHPQRLINLSQYGLEDPYELGSAPYKLVGKEQDGNNTYSFCMCPGGYVVNASSEPGRLAVNGMSYHRRDSSNANSALVMTVHKEQYPEGPLGGIAFQRQLEERAYLAASGRIPFSSLGDLYRDVKHSDYAYSCEEKIDRLFDGFTPCIKGLSEYTSLQGILPEELEHRLLDAIPYFDRMIHGFGHPKAVLAGIESRTSSPVRMNRDDDCRSNIRGIYPCGEGAGYAGGITSAAMDGIRVAEQIAAEIISRQSR